MLELEKKLLLTEREYGILLNHDYFRRSAEVQKNYYYDTVDHELNRKGITCRIREKNGLFVATIKEHQSNWKECSVESTRILTHREDDSFFTDMGLCYQGCLTTERITYRFCPSVQMMLDKNSYLSTMDYELEIEYTPESQKEAFEAFRVLEDTLISSGAVDSRTLLRQRSESPQNKASRFFLRKRKWNREE